MKLQKVLLTSFLLSVVIFSCKKTTTSDNTAGITTVQEDRAFLNSVTQQTSDCIRGVRDGGMSQSVIQFLNISNGVSGNDAWASDMSDKLELIMGRPIQLDDNNYSKFDFGFYVGQYTWNQTAQTFIKTPANSIIIKIPSSPVSTSNNVTITLSSYNDHLYAVNADYVYLPTAIQGSITKDNVQIASLSFTANYSTINFPVPINLNFSMFMAPHQYNLSVSQINSTKFNISSSLMSGAGCGMNINATLTFNNDDYSNFILEDYLQNVQAEYNTGDLTIRSNFDAYTYFSLSNQNSANLNSTLNTMVYYRNAKIGDMKFQDVLGERRMYIIYKDGSMEDTSIYYDPFITNFKNILRPVFGSDVDSWF
jgi:hypothetical protein